MNAAEIREVPECWPQDGWEVADAFDAAATLVEGRDA